MTATVEANILARDNSKKGNIEIVEYLKKNMRRLVRKGIRFKFKIIEEDEIKILVKKNITKVPVMITKKSNYMGADDIIDALEKFIESVSKTQPRPAPETSDIISDPEIAMQKYNESIMNPKAREADEEAGEENEMGNFLKKGVAEMLQARAEVKPKPPAVNTPVSGYQSTPKRKDNVKSSGGSKLSKGLESRDLINDAKPMDKDDQMLMAMFEET